MVEARGKSSVISCMLLVVTVVAASAMSISAGRIVAPNCKEEQQLGTKACMGLLMNNMISPSPECCTRIRVSHTTCVCPLVTPEIAPLLDPKRVRALIERCGRKLPPRFKCGSVTIP